MDNNSQFTGWAMLELFGHQREAGYVTTQYFGNAAMFQLDVPELPEREYTLVDPGYVSDEAGHERWAPEGSKVKREREPGRTRLINPSAIYALNPCTEEAARKAIESITRRGIKLISLPDGKALPASADEEPSEADIEEECR